MPFKGNRIIGVIVIVFILIFFAVLLGASGSGTPESTQQQRGDPKYSVTIHSESVGLDYIKVTNENTGAIAHILPQYLPMQINFAANDILTFTVYPKANYRFNFWSLSDGTIESDNPLSMKPAKSFEMNALFMPDNIIGNVTIE